MTIPVVDISFLGIAQDLVRLGRLLESLLRLPVARIPVGVMLHGEPSIAFFDLLQRGVTLHPQNLIIINAL